MNVTTIAIPPGIQVMACYRENEHTRKEFDAQVKVSLSPEVAALITSVRETYERATTYTDTGTSELIADVESIGKSTFKTI